MRVFVGIISVLGAAIFGVAWLLSYTNPVLVESIARDLVRIEVERRVGEKIDSLEAGKLAELAKRASGRNTAEIAALKQRLAAGLPQKIAAIAAEMRNADCPCRQAIEKNLTRILDVRVADLSRLNERLSLLIRSQYVEVAVSLTREFRIFTGANALMFALLGLVAGLRGKARLQLALPSAVLVGAAVLVGSLYLFNQDWLRTVVFADYVGLGYFAYVGAATAFLGDIAFNRARITTEIVNGLLQAIGSAATAVPC